MPSEDLGLRKPGWCRMEGERSSEGVKEEVSQRVEVDGGEDG